MWNFFYQKKQYKMTFLETGRLFPSFGGVPEGQGGHNPYFNKNVNGSKFSEKCEQLFLKIVSRTVATTKTSR